MSSIQLKEMAEFYNETRSRFLNSNIGLATQRDVVERLHLAGVEPEGVSYAEVDANGVPSLWCIPENCHRDHVLLHMHAGGSVVWSIHTDRKAVGHIAKAVGARALLVGFRRAPEHKYPAQIEDVEKAYRWLLEEKILPSNIASIGHSIGGNLAVNLAVTLRAKGVPLPGAILAVSPWCDLEVANQRLDSNAETDKLLTKELLGLFRDLMLEGTGVAPSDPRVNMLHADLTGIPPIMVYYGSHELLGWEAVEFANRAKMAGVDVSLRCLSEGQHNFLLGAGRVPEVDRAIKEMAHWLRSKLHLPQARE
jgi:epsilon-lactone hydrolase